MYQVFYKLLQEQDFLHQISKHHSITVHSESLKKAFGRLNKSVLPSNSRNTEESHCLSAVPAGNLFRKTKTYPEKFVFWHIREL